MSGSFVLYRGQSFEANDTLLQIWLHFVLNEICEEADLPDWLSELMDEWSYQSTSPRVGTVFPYLDSFARADEHRSYLILLCEKALQSLREQSSISKDYLSGQGIGGNVEFYEDVRAEWIISVGQKFICLLKGELTEADQ